MFGSRGRVGALPARPRLSPGGTVTQPTPAHPLILAVRDVAEERADEQELIDVLNREFNVRELIALTEALAKILAA